jgi:hypothetical protein
MTIMFRITRRHSLATLTVLAGLFSAAGPAVAAPAPFLVDGPFSAKAPSCFSWSETQIPTAVAAPSGSDFVVDGPLTVRPASVACDGIGA